MNIDGPVLKCDASDELKDKLLRIETNADDCHVGLRILRFPANFAIWSFLSYVAGFIENEFSNHSPCGFQLSALMSNLGAATQTVVSWIHSCGRPASKLASLRWNSNDGAAAQVALSTALNYIAFKAAFPMWHRNYYFAELLADNHARFTVGHSSRQRQIIAYLQGHRPSSGEHAANWSSPIEVTPRRRRMFEDLLNSARIKGPSEFRYDDPWNLWQDIRLSYAEKVNHASRRSGGLLLGTYNIAELNRFYIALLAICATHEHLCFARSQLSGHYPFASGAIVRLRSCWSSAIARLSGIDDTKAADIIDDLTFDFERPLDLLISPFVPLGAGSPWLAVVPWFAIRSRHEENALYLCSLKRPLLYDETSLQKEDELLERLKRDCARYSPIGPRKLPIPNPDIDLILTDELESTIVFIEAKWIRQTKKPSEHPSRDREVAKGLIQLEKIKTFIFQNPLHLANVEAIPYSIDHYKNAYFILLARDHWLWAEPCDGISIHEFDAFLRVITRAPNLNSAIQELLTYEWLPIEGRDFFAKMETAMAGRMYVDTETMYASGSHQYSV